MPARQHRRILVTASSGGITIAALTHDFIRKRSTVALVWDGDPEKSVSLFVPFKCGLDEVHSEAEKALRELSAEIATIPVKEAE
jgi:hypothetical protein